MDDEPFLQKLRREPKTLFVIAAFAVLPTCALVLDLPKMTSDRSNWPDGWDCARTGAARSQICVKR